MVAIETQQLRKDFRIPDKAPGVVGSLKQLVAPRYISKVAVQDLDLTIDHGESVGFIGVNGAGKSTTVKMLTGILYPSGGTISVLGRHPYKQRSTTAAQIGVVFGQRSQLWWDLPLLDSLEMMQRIYDVPRPVYLETLALLERQLELNEIINKPIRSMSLGQKMRGELAALLIHRPRIAFLDEPTIGLDIVAKERLRESIKTFNAAFEMTVFLTSHDLSDINNLCERIIIVDGGRKIYDGRLTDLTDALGRYRHVHLKVASPRQPDLPPGAEISSQNGTSLVIRFDRGRLSASRLLETLLPQIEIEDFSIEEPSLESIVRHIYIEGLEPVSELV
jgi:ABC-2 type transport system ATP-binding protein